MAKQPSTGPSLQRYLREQARAAQRQADTSPPGVVTGAAVVPATTPGPVVGSIEVFDADGNSIGFLAVYSTIT